MKRILTPIWYYTPTHTIDAHTNKSYLRGDESTDISPEYVLNRELMSLINATNNLYEDAVFILTKKKVNGIYEYSNTALPLNGEEFSIEFPVADYCTTKIFFNLYSRLKKILAFS